MNTQQLNPGYKPPKKPGYLGSYNWRSTVVGLTGLLLTCVGVTQYLANAFAYQEALGSPVYGPVLLAGESIYFYAPWDWLVWLFRFGMSSTPEVHRPIMQGFVYAIAGIALSMGATAVMNIFARRDLLKDTDALHGSARWATKKEVEDLGLFDDGKASVYIGGYQDKNNLRYLRHGGPEHVVCIAPSGSGKGVGIVVPTLLNWNESVIVYDIKGENWQMTAGFRQAAGQLCLRLEPVSGTGARFNPLSEVRIGTDREISDAQNIAEMLCRTGKESANEEHWIVTATSLVAGLIIHACYAAYNQGRVATLADLRMALTPTPDAVDAISNPNSESESTGARRFYENIVGDDGNHGFPHDEEMAFGWVTPTGEPTQTHPFVVESLLEMLNREDKEFTGVLSTATKAIALYRDPLVARTVSASDFTINDLVNAEKPVSLYIIVPPSDSDRLTPFVRLLFTMILNRLSEEMNPDKENKHKLLLLIDEFPTLGKFTIFAKAFAYLRGYGLRAFLIAQDIDQIIDSYGQHENIMSNCDVKIFYAPNKTNTAKTLSEMTGTTTVQRAALSFSGNRVSPLMGNVSANVEHVSRPLLTPDEVLKIPRPKKEKKADGTSTIVESGDMLVFIAGQPAIYGRQILFFKDPTMLDRVKKFKAPKTSYAIQHTESGERIVAVAQSDGRKQRLLPKSLKAAPLPLDLQIEATDAESVVEDFMNQDADDDATTIERDITGTFDMDDELETHGMAASSYDEDAEGAFEVDDEPSYASSSDGEPTKEGGKHVERDFSF